MGIYTSCTCTNKDNNTRGREGEKSCFAQVELSSLVREKPLEKGVEASFWQRLGQDAHERVLNIEIEWLASTRDHEEKSALGWVGNDPRREDEPVAGMELRGRDGREAIKEGREEVWNGGVHKNGEKPRAVGRAVGSREGRLNMVRGRRHLGRRKAHFHLTG